MKIVLAGFRLEITDGSGVKKFTFINSRLMNARQFYFFTKKKTMRIIIPMPSLFYQKWNKEKGWQEDHPTRYHKVFIKIRHMKEKIKTSWKQY